jgi:alpha-L-fucosidase
MNRKFKNHLLGGMYLAIGLVLAPFQSPAAQMEIVPGKFTGTVDSLTNYVCPDWFRDAKFGIWAHWGPQAVPRAGDWYARNMYLQGSPQYESHLKHFGHPSTNGYKDIIQLWKAEKWDPDALMGLYVKAGAKYFVSMGVHHDNFDLWNSKYHRWNAVKMGPHRDIVGEWKKAADKYGLRFGVSEHLGPSYGWFAPSHGYDQFYESGARLGVPYDGADPKYQDLYHPDNNEPFRWGPSWYATNLAWHLEWFNRIRDLVDQYQPDLLYTDGGIPFGEVGRSLVAHFYNANAAAHSGHLEGVYNHKNMGTGEFIREAGVEDVERGVMADIDPLPWQTDTSIGDWFYSDGFKYKTTAEVVHMLADIVSKNGNMLLNVVLYADGSLPPESKKFLDEMSVWMDVNGEAIYGTRPWKIFGEGPTITATGHFKEDTAYTARDIRFTTKNAVLYAISLGRPQEGKVIISSLAKTGDAKVNQIKEIKLLGSDHLLKFTQTDERLTVELPTQEISYLAFTLKIIGINLQPVKQRTTASVIHADTQGNVTLSAVTAKLHGSRLGLQTQGGLPDLGFWNNGDDSVSWTSQIDKAGIFGVNATVATLNANTNFVVEIDGKKNNAQAPMTGSWDKFQTVDHGPIQIQSTEDLVVKDAENNPATCRTINLNSVRLTPAD